MKSGISFFDKGVFTNTLRRFMPMWIAYFGLMFIVFPFSRFIDSGFISSVDNIRNFTIMSGAFSTLVSAIAAILCACAVFSFMYNARTTGLICSLPVRREAVFCSAYLAGFLPVLVSNIVNGLLLLLLSAGQDFFGNAVLAYLQWLAIFTMQFVLFYGIAAFIAMMTGVGVVLPVLYGIINFLAIGMEAVIREIITPFVYGFSVNNGYFISEVLSPCWYLLTRADSIVDDIVTYAEVDDSVVDLVVTDAYMKCDMWGTLAIFFAVGILLSAAALLVYRKRKMECTGDVIAVRSMRPVFKYGVTFCAALCTGLIFYYIFGFGGDGGLAGAAVMVFFMFAGALVGYFASEMLLHRSFHVFKGRWLGYIISCICCFILVGCCYIDVFNIETHVPDTDKLESISFPTCGVTVNDPQYFDDVTDLQISLVKNRDYHCKSIDGYYGEYNGSYSCTYFTIIYNFIDGSYECRDYYLRIGEKNADADTLDRLLNLPGNTNERFPGDEPVTVDNISYSNISSFAVDETDGSEMISNYDLTPALAADLYNNAIKKDIEEGSLGRFSAYKDYYYYEEPTSTYYAFAFELISYDKDGDAHYNYYDIEINAECENSMQWIKDHMALIESLGE